MEIYFNKFQSMNHHPIPLILPDLQLLLILYVYQVLLSVILN